jgi:hypothetical protein
MKKLLSVAMLVAMLVVMLAVITPAYAGDVDGLWYSSTPDHQSVAMARVNEGYLLFTVMGDFTTNMNFWMPFFGPFDGTTGDLSLILTSEANGNLAQLATLTFRLTSPTTATVTTTSCTNFENQDNCLPNGTVLNLTKIF